MQRERVFANSVSARLKQRARVERATRVCLSIARLKRASRRARFL